MLVALQRIDNRIQRLEDGKVFVDSRVAEAVHRAEDLRAECAAAMPNVRARRAEVDKKELQLKGIEEKAAKLTVQLNVVKTNKEYSALQHEIATQKADAELLEDEMLLLMDEADKEDAKRIQAEIRFKDVEKHVAEVRAECKQEKALLDEELQKLIVERDAMASQLNRELCDLYEKIYRGKSGSAVVRAALADRDNRTCSGCFMRLTSNTASLLLGGNELVRCHSCGRILYIDGKADAEIPASADEI